MLNRLILFYRKLALIRRWFGDGCVDLRLRRGERSEVGKVEVED